MQDDQTKSKLHMVFEKSKYQEEYSGIASYLSDVLWLIDSRLELYHRFIECEHRYALQHEADNGARAEIRNTMEMLEKMNEQLKRTSAKMKEKAAEAANKGIMISLEYLFQCFRTTPFIRYCVYLSLAAELDGYYDEKIQYDLQNENIHRPTLDFCINTYSLGNRNRIELLQEIEKERISLKYFFFLNEWPEEALLQTPLYLDQRIYTFLYDYEAMNQQLQRDCRLYYADEEMIQPLLVQENILNKLKVITKRVTQTSILFLSGAAGSGKRLLAFHYSRDRRRQLLTVDLTRYKDMTEDEKAKFLFQVVREAVIRQAYLCFYHYERFFQQGSKEENTSRTNVLISFLKTLLPADGMFIFLLSENEFHLDKKEFPLPLIDIEVESLTVDERIILWQEQQKKMVIQKEINIEALAAKFRFTPGVIEAAAKEAEIIAAYENDGEVNEDILYLSCRKQLDGQFKNLAHPVEVKYHWEDIVLPSKQKNKLREACNQIEYQHLIYDTWGFGKKIAYGKGVSMMFYGPPGTGKTMAAQVIANELHLELYKVDSAAVTSKYIGETQKNLDAVFEGAGKSQSILFFDEADALFGKRAEVKEANDKYANAETAFLLQKMEEHEGVVILATNLMQNFDEAFKRRIKFIIEIPFPNKEERLAMWKKVFPKEAPVGNSVDYEYLAQQFELSGSSIKNIAVAAAFLAGAQKQEIQMGHILSSLLDEVQKAGKQIGKEDLGEYFYLLPAYGSTYETRE